jgi:hypothetical protein
MILEGGYPMRKDSSVSAALVGALSFGAWSEVSHDLVLERPKPEFLAMATLVRRETVTPDHAPETASEEVEPPLLGVYGSSGTPARGFNYADFAVLPASAGGDVWTLTLRTNELHDLPQ